MTSRAIVPSSWRKLLPMSRYLTVLPSSSLAICALTAASLSRIEPGFSPRGKTPRRRILVSGSFSRSDLTMAVTPLAISSAVFEPELLVPIIRTTTLGWIPSTSPCSSRQRTCSVRSPPMPKLAALRGA